MVFPQPWVNDVYLQVSKLRPVALERRNDPDQPAPGDRREDTVNYCQPVLMDGTRSEIWVNEVEK